MDLLDGLDAAQLAAVTSPSVPVRVMARAGTGKTRVVTRRIAWRAAQGDLDIRRVLAITFTTRAADELRSRLGDLLGRDTGTTGTFHAIAWRMLRDHHAEQHTTPPAVLENPRAAIADLLPADRRGAVAPVATEIAWASARGIAPDGYAEAARRHGRTTPLSADDVADLYDAYRTHKARRGVVDFDDLIVECLRLLETDTGFAAAQRWRYRHFFVDEYQDVNPLQQRLLDAWLGDRDDLFVVGDPHQAIYGFNGADARHLTDFTTRYPHAVSVELTTNHRSDPGVVAAADAVLARPGPRRVAPVATCTVTACADDTAEALTIARALRAAHTPGRRWRSQAVLVRTHAQADGIVELLDRAGIPVARTDDHTGRDAVRVTSFHSAKGLEWPVVHVAGVEEGYVPDIHARTDAALGEERRLLYVALSRATQRVHVTWARRRRFGTRTLDRSPSRWLAAVETAAGPATHPPRRGTSSGPVAPLPTVPSADTPRERLLRWRASTARAAAVPVSVVLPDAVLDELVRLAPGDHDALHHVRGLGPIKAGRYGGDLLAALHPGSPPSGSTP